MRRAAVLLGLALAAPSAWAATCRVAVDVGHTQAQPGATSASGATEWRFNQALARRLEGALARAGVAVTVINPDGGAIGLKDRPAEAARLGASLLVSLHHDSAQPHYLVNGASERFSGFGIFLSGKNGAPEESARVGIAIADGLRAAGLTPSLHHAEPIAGENRPLLDAERGIYRYDDLVVLKYATLPAVLVEAGIIVNPADERALATDAVRDRIAAAIAGAAVEHCRRVENAAPIR